MSDVLVKTLTEEQRSLFPKYIRNWISYSISTSRTNKEFTEELINKIYVNRGLNKPKEFEYFDSPFAIVKKYHIENWNMSASFCYSNHEAWLVFYDYFMNECKLWGCAAIEPFIKLAGDGGCGWWIPTEETCFISHRPTSVCVNSNGMLHNETGPAIEYADGFKVYALYGVRVKKEEVTNVSN